MSNSPLVTDRTGPSADGPVLEPRRIPRALAGAHANERLTAGNAVLLLLLLAAEGATVLSVRSLLSIHVFLGGVLIPLVAVKIATTTSRFVHYYRGEPEYVRKGPPPWILRLLGPAVVALTVVLFGSGVALLFPTLGSHRLLLLAHKASFILWFGTMTVHVLGHLAGTSRHGLPEWTRRHVPGAPVRRAVLLAAVGSGLAAGFYLLTRVSPYLGSGAGKFFGG